MSTLSTICLPLLPPTYGIIYLAKNKINGKVYVGQTVSKLSIRKNSHNHDSKNDKTVIFHNALKKYGDSSFEWIKLDEAVSLVDLNMKEKYWIKFYRSTDCRYGYNMTDGGEGTQGRKLSTNTKAAISKSMKGKALSDDHKKKLHNAHQGKERSKEVGEAISKSLKGRVFTDEWKENLRRARIGKVHTEQTKQKMREAWVRRKQRSIYI